jgi:ATP-dependent protease ClpP protease subunit
MLFNIILLILPCFSDTTSFNHSSSLFNDYETVELNIKNSMIIKGIINEELATQFIYDLNLKKSKTKLYIFLDTPGGSVEHGNKIVAEILKYKISCIAERAYSMGFVILQSCHKRYITPYGKIMQHQMSYGVRNEKAKIESYVDFVDQIENELTEMQSNRIGISSEEFNKRIFNDWWLVGKKAIYQNCVDEMIHVKCSVKLTALNYTMSNDFYELTYSKCPLISGHLVKKSISNPNKIFFF